jgi:hypothetical protein
VTRLTRSAGISDRSPANGAKLRHVATLNLSRARVARIKAEENIFSGISMQRLLFAVILSLLASCDSQAGASCEGRCSGHGQCIDDGVCLCEVGHFGSNCSHSQDAWKKMHKLEHNFYEHSAFKSRYMLAAHYLRRCRHIVEVGGYRTPITDFLRSSNHLSITVLDPYIKPLAVDTFNGVPCKVRHLPMLFEEYRLNGNEDCFVYMGLDYYNTQNEPMYTIFSRARISLLISTPPA